MVGEAPLIGRALGDFIVREQIGAGGFGVVYRAEQPLLGREAVVKVSTAVSSPEYVTRFLREARLASKLDHPYAAHIYAFGSEDDGTLWTAMELVRGTPLDQLIKQQGALRLERFVPLFDKLCEVVHTAHEQGIIHRDLKPANVMVLSRAGRLLPKLLDLGIAKGEDATGKSAEPAPTTGEEEPRVLAVEGGTSTLDLATSMRHTRAGRHLGTPAYMAPEQWIDARKADARTDVYALGILAYEGLTGRLPFSGTTVMGIARLHAKQPVPALGGELPPALDAVIAKAMAKKSADRYATALELGAALRQAAALDVDAVKLPELDPFLREEMLANAPQPLAEAVAAFDGVRNAHQAQGAMFGVVRVIVRMLGNLALACRCHAPSAGDARPEVTYALRTLRKHGLSDLEWVGLTREITGAVREQRETFPLPELVELFHPAVASGEGAAADLEALISAATWFDQHLAGNEAAMLERLGQALPRLDRLLRGLLWMSAYAMVAQHGEWGERWMGVRRPQRAVCPIRGAAAATAGRLVILDPDGAVILPLAPLFQIAPPAPGHLSEVFVLDGANRDGARLVSLPTGFERTDEQLWTWFADKLALEGVDEREERAEDQAPYRGLATFTPADADRFVGRERETEAFTNRLRVTPLLVVVGASGAGKSSFVQAGLVPALGDRFTTLIVRPGTTPISTLTAVLHQAELGAAGLSIDGEELPEALRVWASKENRSLLVYIDQFEELFTLCHDPVERERYVAALIRLARSADDPIRVVLTVRDDFLLRCQQVEALRERLVHGLQLLATPTPGDLQRILIEPARRAGYQFEDPELPVEMVAEVAEMPAALPLLSFTASQMWDLRDRHHHRLSRKAYETLGGVGGALAQHAERVFGQMPSDEQRLVRVGFRNLVTADGTRAVLTRAELLEVLGRQASAESVLEKLITARLLTASEGVGGDRVEVVHEALLSAWPRLIDWRREDAEGSRLRDQLRAAARQWEERGRPRGLLWRDEALTEYQLWRTRHGGQLMAIEQEFGDASAREALRGRRLRNAAIGTILAVLVVGMVVALVLYRDAESQRVRAISNEERASSLVTAGYVSLGQRAGVAGDANRALVYLAKARHGGASGPAVDIPIAEGRRSMIAEKAVYRGHRGKLRGLAVMPDGKAFATSGADHKVVIWSVDSETPRAEHAESKVGINTLVASHDGKWVVAASTDGHVWLYEVATGKLAHAWALDDGNIFTAGFTPDDHRVVAYTENQEVGVWDVATGAVVKRWKAEGETAGFGDLSADGRLLAITSYDRQTRIWDISTAKLVRTVGPHDDTAWDAAFSPDGTLLATASWDKTAKLWNLATGALIATLVGHSAAIDIAEWSRDGALVATGARDGTVRLWDRKGQLQTTLVCAGNVHDISWAPDGKRVLAACGDATVIFDVSTGLPVFRKQATGEGAYGVRQLANGEIISVEDDGTARRWLPVTNVAFAQRGHEKGVTRLDRCADGAMLTVSEDQTAKLWSVRGDVLWQTPKAWKVDDATCSETAQIVFGVRDDGTLWRFEGAAAPVAIKVDAALPAKPIIGLSPDGARIAVVDEDQKALLVATATGHVTSGSAATFKRTWEPKLYWAHDGSAFALMSDAGAVAWDGATAARRFEVLPPGGLVRRILIDSSTESLYVSAMAPDVHRYSLRDGTETVRYANAGFAWGMVLIGSSLYVGLDNGTVVEYEVATGKLVGTVGSFGADVFSVADAGSGLLWVASGSLTLSLVDRATRAVVFRTQLPTDPMFLSARGLDAAIAGLSGTLAFVHIDSGPVDLERLDLEVQCRSTVSLSGGSLEPREPDLGACQTLANRR